MKNAVKRHYESYWSRPHGGFDDYLRNSLLLSLIEQGQSVLDVGCGDGTIAREIQKKTGVRVVGIDISAGAVRRARQKGIDARVADVERKLSFADQSFDTVLWGDNAEHLFDPIKTAKEIRRVLKKNGRLIISCPNMAYWRHRLYYLVKGQLPDTEWTGNPPWSWSHIRFFNDKILKEFLAASGFRTIIKIIGISPRRLDQPFLKIFPSLFGLILLVEAS